MILAIIVMIVGHDRAMNQSAKEAQKTQRNEAQKALKNLRQGPP